MDVRNLFAEGYRPFVSLRRQHAVFCGAARCVQGGLSLLPSKAFTFRVRMDALPGSQMGGCRAPDKAAWRFVFACYSEKGAADFPAAGGFPRAVFRGRVAQLAEHSTLNRQVEGSIPSASTMLSSGLWGGEVLHCAAFCSGCLEAQTPTKRLRFKKSRFTKCRLLRLPLS